MAAWFDWGYAALLVLLVPIWGWLDFRAFLKRADETGEDILSPEYRKTILFHLGLLVILIAIWIATQRPWSVLGFTTPDLSGQEWFGLIISFSAATGIAINLIMAVYFPKSDEKRLQAYSKIAAFLPKTKRQHRWGMLVSVSAGVVEEVIYRGFMIWLLSQFMSIYAALAVQAVIFGLVHVYQGWGGVITTGVIGAVFGMIFWATGSLLLPILLHTGMDMAALTAAYITYVRNPEAVRAA